jgi:DNA (cytosine-5)-methyltransferase 1
MNELALFAGAGGGILGGHLLGWRTVCAVEWEQYPASVLCARQNDGLLPPFPIWDDVQTFDGKPWRGIVDVVSGGFPCQDISAAGKGAGIDGERSGMWGEMARIIGEVRPKYAFVENSPMLTSRGLGTVLADLAAMGFDAEWGVLSAANVGANHKRDRIWIVAKNKLAHSNLSRREQGNEKIQRKSSKQFNGNGIQSAQNVPDSNKQGSQRGLQDGVFDSEGWEKQSIGRVTKCGVRWQGIGNCDWSSEPDVGRVVDGMAARVDRLKAIGNGQVPLCAATAWRLLSERHA